MLSFLLIASYAVTISGECGEDVKYSYDEDNYKIIILSCGFTANKCVCTDLCGTSLSYIFDNCIDVLTIYGVGDMYNYTIDSVPWISFKDSIK